MPDEEVTQPAEQPVRTEPQLAILVEGTDRKGLLHDMTAAILEHDGFVHSVEILERGERSAILWELDQVGDPDALIATLEAIDVVASVRRLPSMFQIYGKRVIVVGAGAQVGQVARLTGTTSAARRSASTPFRSWAKRTWRRPCGPWPASRARPVLCWPVR
jgi:energy-converting hydrogenase B subunit Q